MNATRVRRGAATLVVIALVLVGGSVSAAPLPPGSEGAAEPLSMTGTVASAISYQGRLTNGAGVPQSGTFAMVFQIWDAASGGTQIGTDISLAGVPVTDGLFTVKLDIPSGSLLYVDGRGLWLRIQVGGQWLTPRQALLPTPYALTLRPGAIISSPGPDALHVWNTSGGYAIEGWSQNNIALLGSNGGPHGTPPAGMIGVYGIGDGYGVYAQGGHTGVYGNGTADGVKGQSGAGNAVHGISTSGTGVLGTSSTSRGVEGYSASNFGVHGQSDTSNGVVGWTGTTSQSEISGVFGHSEQGTGVTGRSVSYNGIKAITQSNVHAALAAGNEGGGPAIYAQGGTDGISAVFRGNVRVQSLSTGGTIIELGEGLDYAEGFDVTGESGIEPGTVLVIDVDHPGELAMSRVAYDRKVAGIVAGAAGLGSGVRLGAEGYDYDVALAGRVYCNVDATYGAVEPGDLLTTSATPGYAMKVTDHAAAQGAILGKAMEGLAEGQVGQILVLVTLQ